MDIAMAGLDGIEATRRIREGAPGTRVLGLSMHREKKFVGAMLAAGASGYLVKSSAARELADAVRLVAAGSTYLSPTLAADVAKELARTSSAPPAHGGAITRREREVARLARARAGHEGDRRDARAQPEDGARAPREPDAQGRRDLRGRAARYALSEGLDEP